METRLSYGYAIWVNQYTSSLHGLDEPGRSSFASFLSVVVVGRRAFSFVTVVNLKYSVHPEDKSEAVRKSDDYSLDGSRKKRVKSRRVRGMILAAQSEAFKQENVLVERLRGLDQQMERKGDESLYFMDRIWVLLVGSHPQADGQSERMIHTLEDIMRACVIDFGGSYHLSIRSAPFEALYGRKCRSLVLWAEIRESSLTGLELVHETINKVVLVKEKPKAVRDCQKSYVDYRRKPLEFKVGDRVLLKIKVDKTLRFVEESLEIMDREIRKLKGRKIVLVKVRWNSKHGPEFTWEHEDQMRIKRVTWGIHGDVIVERNYFLVRRITCGYPWPELEGKRIWYDPRAIEVVCLVFEWLIGLTCMYCVWHGKVGGFTCMYCVRHVKGHRVLVMRDRMGTPTQYMICWFDMIGLNCMLACIQQDEVKVRKSG
ncbi:putative reverse transcriptase domain-containing protein [Tanacetum coccineum]